MKKQILFWSSRALAILAILFMMLFSLDCLGGPPSIKDQLICLLMHNIPAFIILIVLLIAWKWEMAGGVLFVLAALTGSIYFRGFTGNPGVLVLMAPILLSGILFILQHTYSNK